MSTLPGANFLPPIYWRGQSSGQGDGCEGQFSANFSLDFESRQARGGAPLAAPHFETRLPGRAQRP